MVKIRTNSEMIYPLKLVRFIKVNLWGTWHHGAMASFLCCLLAFYFGSLNECWYVWSGSQTHRLFFILEFWSFRLSSISGSRAHILKCIQNLTKFDVLTIETIDS